MRDILHPLLIAVVLTFTHGACAQDERLPTPYDPRGAHQTWGFKGKAFPFPLGDHLGLTALLGVEYGFLKRQSLGVDGFIAHTFGTYDAFTDTAGGEHPDGGRTWTT